MFLFSVLLILKDFCRCLTDFLNYICYIGPEIKKVVIASQPQTFMGGLLVVPSKERDWDNRRRAAYLVREEQYY